ncbi:hypothetical protein QJS66_14345 [Kocuria rhizophila]|nr:hypothetical protein QJS66_14345 [Kocuria rhizophila]
MIDLLTPEDGRPVQRVDRSSAPAALHTDAAGDGTRHCHGHPGDRDDRGDEPATQFITQKQLTARNMSQTAKPRRRTSSSQRCSPFLITSRRRRTNLPWARSSLDRLQPVVHWAAGSGGSSATTPPKGPRRSASQPAARRQGSAPRGHDQ